MSGDSRDGGGRYLRLGSRDGGGGEAVNRRRDDAPCCSWKMRRWVLLGAALVVAAAGLLVWRVVGERRGNAAASCEARGTTRVLFVFRDAGESLALLPVLRSLRSGETGLGECAQAVVTGGGTAPPDLSQQDGVVMFAQLGLGPLQNRSSLLPSAQVSKLAATFSPEVLVTGLVSAVQMQIADALAATATTVVGYDDGFGTEWPEDSWASQTLASGSLQQLWVAAAPEAAAARAHSSRGVVSHTEITAVGSPTLEAWQQNVQQAGPMGIGALSARIRGPGSPDTPLLHFFGGYDSPKSRAHPYLDSVDIFGSAVHDLQALGPLVATFNPHPGHNGSVEEQVFRNHGAAVSIVTDVSSALLAAVANLTFSHDSTCGIQSLFVGTGHVFVGPPRWANIASAVGLAPFAHNVSELVSEIQYIAARGFGVNLSTLSQAGIPTGSAAIIERRILGLLQCWVG